MYLLGPVDSLVRSGCFKGSLLIRRSVLATTLLGTMLLEFRGAESVVGTKRRFQRNANYG
jgi:hypothetical protein